MIRKRSTTYDVFVSHQHADAEIARQVAEVLRSFDLAVFLGVDQPDILGATLEDVIWDAIAESNAIVAILPENPLEASLAFEMGAAKAWSKPVYGIVPRITSSAIPTAFRGMQIFPLSRITEVAREIAQSSQPLPDSDYQHLVDAYTRIGLSVDQLAMQPARLSKLSTIFYGLTKRRVPVEKLLSQLLRVRKQGKLPSLSVH